MKKELNKNPKDLDQIFKEGLSNFQVPPPSRKQPEDINPLDEAVKNVLNEFESTPSANVWENVKRRIPFSLKVKRQLNWWTKVAAALIIGLAATVALKEYQAYKAAEMVIQPEKNEAVPAIPIDSDFVYELRNDGKNNITKSNNEESAREILSDEVVTLPERVVEPVSPLENKVESVVSTLDNPLNEEQKSSGKLGEVPLRTVNTSDIGTLTIKEKEDQNKEQENRNK